MSGLFSNHLLVITQMFQALARDRLERLNASPSATPWAYFRVYSVLLMVLSVDYFWYGLISPLFQTKDQNLIFLYFHFGSFLFFYVCFIFSYRFIVWTS